MGNEPGESSASVMPSEDWRREMRREWLMVSKVVLRLRCGCIWMWPAGVTDGGNSALSGQR